MPYAAPRPCNHPGCGALTHARFCEAHAEARRKRYEGERPSAARRGYGHKWRKAREQYLKQNPMCEELEADGTRCREPATDVDHKIPHRGDLKLFWDRKNWQALCHSHHSAKTARDDGRWKERPAGAAAPGGRGV